MEVEIVLLAENEKGESRLTLRILTNQRSYLLVAIEESMRGRPKTLGMFLSPFGNLSHTSILYYYK